MIILKYKIKFVIDKYHFYWTRLNLVFSLQHITRYIFPKQLVLKKFFIKFIFKKLNKMSCIKRSIYSHCFIKGIRIWIYLFTICIKIYDNEFRKYVFFKFEVISWYQSHCREIFCVQILICKWHLSFILINAESLLRNDGRFFLMICIDFLRETKWQHF